MANTTAVYARIDTQLKNDAENILSQLGITPSVMIQMLYRQIVLQRRVPFEIGLPVEKPTAIGGMTEERIAAEIQKGLDSIKGDRFYSAEEINREFDGLL